MSAALANDPAIRALSLKPYRIDEGRYQIVGRLGTYDLTIGKDGATCNCTAANYGRTCAHSIAALRQYIIDRRASMKITATRPQGGTEYERKQPVRIKQRGIYGGLLKRYTAPKDYQKYKSTEMEEKFFVTFLVTHDAGARPLPRFTEAFCGVKTIQFYDNTTDMASTLVRLYAALLNGKMTPEQIADAQELPDLDDLIGYPAMLSIAPSLKPDKNGIYVNKIDTASPTCIMPADQAMRRAAKPIYDSAELKYDKAGLRYLAQPDTAFEDNDGPIHDDGDVPSGGDDEDPW